MSKCHDAERLTNLERIKTYLQRTETIAAKWIEEPAHLSKIDKHLRKIDKICRKEARGISVEFPAVGPPNGEIYDHHDPGTLRYGDGCISGEYSPWTSRVVDPA